MSRLLVVDDTPTIDALDDYRSLFSGNEVHYALCIDNDVERMAAEQRRLPARLKEKYRVASSTIYSYGGLVDYLKRSQGDFDKIVMDGLEGRCMGIINEVPLSPEKVVVVSNNPDIVRNLREAGYSAKSKLMLSPALIMG